MDELRAYVDALFARRGDTPENRDLKEEIYGNLAARRDDLIAQGVPEPPVWRHLRPWRCSAFCICAAGGVIRQRS